MVAPLHVFEPRYRQMVNDLLDGPGRLVLATIKPGSPAEDPNPGVLPVGSLAEIVRHEELEDGRFLVVLASLGRVEMEEIPSDRLYRQVNLNLIPDEDPEPESAMVLKAQLLAALESRADGELTADLTAPIGRLADVLLSILPLNIVQKSQAFLETDSTTRAALALKWDLQDLQDEMEAEGGV